MRKRKGSEGFTLVELIVVIAILGILAGAGTVAYTGYVQRAQKSTDQQNVANLIYAAQLADYADSSLFGDDGSGLVIITESGTSAYGTYSDFASALENSVGSLSSISLSYGGYSTSASTYSTMLSNVAALSTYTSGTDSEGNAVTYSIGYADAASDLWDSVIETATTATEALGFSDDIAANYTLLTAYAIAYYSSMEDMGEAWSSGKAYSNTFDTALFSAANGGGDMASYMTIANNLALPASRKAYNEAFAVYLAANYSYDGIDDDVAALKNEYSKVLVSTSESMSGNSQYATAVNAYLGAQAKLDGAAYYQAMYSVNQAYGTGTDDSGGTVEYTTVDLINVDDADAFWSGTSAYVASVAAAYKNYDSIAEMQEALENVDGSAVVILATKSKGGLSCTVSPIEADARSNGSGSTGSSNNESSNYTLSFSPESVTLSTGNSQTVTVSCSDLSFTDSNATTYTFSGIDTSVATATKTSATTFTVTGVGNGTTDITVTVTDSNGKTATGTISVTVSTQVSATMSTRIRYNASSSKWAVSTKEASDTNYNGTATLSAGSVVSLTLEDYTASGNYVAVMVSGNTVKTGTTSGNGDYITSVHTGTVSYSVTNGTYNETSGTVTVGASGETVITVTVTDDNANPSSTASGTFTITISE